MYKYFKAFHVYTQEKEGDKAQFRGEAGAARIIEMVEKLTTGKDIYRIEIRHVDTRRYWYDD